VLLSERPTYLPLYRSLPKALRTNAIVLDDMTKSELIRRLADRYPTRPPSGPMRQEWGFS
jgi:hypothetical protein